MKDWEDIIDILEGLPGYLGEPWFSHNVGPQGFVDGEQILNWSFISAPGENIFLANYFTLARYSLKFFKIIYCQYARYPNDVVGYICNKPGHEYEECVFQKIMVAHNDCLAANMIRKVVFKIDQLPIVETRESLLNADAIRLLNKHLLPSEMIKQ